MSRSPDSHAFTPADQILLPIGGQPDHDHLAVHWPDFVRLTNPLIGRFTADGVFPP